LAKTWATFDFLPEVDHNTLAGTENPTEALEKTYAIFLHAALEQPQNKKRSELTAQSFMLAGIVNDFYNARGNTRLAQQWSALHFGDYVAYYLAMIYGMDPTPIAAIEHFKQAMKA
jgi:glucose/mannose-6-phosphate isomerase